MPLSIIVNYCCCYELYVFARIGMTQTMLIRCLITCIHTLRKPIEIGCKSKHSNSENCIPVLAVKIKNKAHNIELTVSLVVKMHLRALAVKKNYKAWIYALTVSLAVNVALIFLPSKSYIKLGI